MSWIVTVIVVFAAMAWIGSLEKFKAKEEKRAKVELAFLKDIYEKTDDADIRETCVTIANSLLDREYWLVRRHDEDTQDWWMRKIKESDDHFADAIGRLADLKEKAEKFTQATNESDKMMKEYVENLRNADLSKE